MRGQIKERLAAGKMVRILAVGPLANHKVIEIAGAHGGFHGVWIDQEHAALTQREIEVLALACRAAGLDAYVRLAPTDYAAVMRPMETGVGGIMAAQIRSLEQAQQVAAWAKFPPTGVRGMNTANYEGEWALAEPAKFCRQANHDRWLALQIETAEALEQVDAIAAIDGVDHLFVGPVDLSVALGVPGEFMHPKCLDALDQVAHAVRAAGKTWGIVPRGAEHAHACRERGCLLFALAIDVLLLHQGFRTAKSLYADFFAEA